MDNKLIQIDCDGCGCLLDEGDVITCKVDNHSREISLCEDCYRDKIIKCCRCDSTEYRDEAIRSSATGGYYCRNCYDDIFTYCDNCGYEIYRDNGRRCNELCEECDHAEQYSDDYIRHSGSWNYYGTDSILFYGIELEVGSKSYMGLKSMFIDNLDEDFFDIHTDCSITDGDVADEAEIVSHPATYKYLKDHPELWNKVLSYRYKNVISYKTGSCGIHIHLSRNYFTEEHLERFLRMIYLQPSFTYLISQRQSHALRQWANIYDEHNERYSKHALKEKIHDLCHKRYEAVNLTNSKTIELRIFRGTLNPTAFWKNIEYVQALVEFTKNTKNKLTLLKFLNYVADNKDEYCNLQKWIVKRRATLVHAKEPRTFKKVKRIFKYLELL